MKKIMFNDKFGLTEAVLEGRKTMTRRIVPVRYLGEFPNEVDLSEAIYNGHAFMKGEVVAIAQNYKDVREGGYPVDSRYDAFREADWGIGVNGALKGSAGETNKMFVKADLMPHRIRITNVRVERLQEITDADCKREGIDYIGGYSDSYYFGHGVGDLRLGNSYCEAFAALIDKVSGKGTWASNPWVFVYEFELVK